MQISVLLAIRLASYILPVATLIQVALYMGVAEYGNFVIGHAVAGIVLVAGLYGFDVTGVRQIAAQDSGRIDFAPIADIVLARAVVTAIAATIGVGLIALVPRFSEALGSAGILIIWVAGQTLAPRFVLVGANRPVAAAFLPFVASAVILALVLMMGSRLQSASQFAWISAAGMAAFCIVGWALAMKIDFHPGKPSIGGIKTQLRGGRHFFASNMWVAAYSLLHPIFIGLVGSSAIVGAYSLGERVIRAAMGLVSAVADSTLAKIMAAAKHGVKKLRHEVLESARILVGLATLGSAGIMAVGFLAPYFLATPEYDGVFRVLVFSGLVPLVNTVGYIAGTQVLGALRHDKYYARAAMITAIAAPVIMMSLTKIFGLTGAAIGFLAVETILTVIMLGFARSKLHEAAVEEAARDGQVATGI